MRRAKSAVAFIPVYARVYDDRLSDGVVELLDVLLGGRLLPGSGARRAVLKNRVRNRKYISHSPCCVNYGKVTLWEFGK